ncbi:hypothetical protein KCU90_g126, partial [Aureobasidium melanogenum]
MKSSSKGDSSRRSCTRLMRMRQAPRDNLAREAIRSSFMSFDKAISINSFVHGERPEYRSKTNDIKSAPRIELYPFRLLHFGQALHADLTWLIYNLRCKNETSRNGMKAGLLGCVSCKSERLTIVRAVSKVMNKSVKLIYIIIDVYTTGLQKKIDRTMHFSYRDIARRVRCNTKMMLRSSRNELVKPVDLKAKE